EANVINEQVIKLGGKVLPDPEKHPRMAFCFRVQAEIDLGMNKLVEAEFNAKKAFEIFKIVHENTHDHVEIAESLLINAKILHAKGDKLTAINTARQSFEMFERKVGVKHPKTVKANTVLNQFVNSEGNGI